jgi:putative hydrolase of the HAD superfamily
MIKYKHIFFDLDQTLWDFKSSSKLILEQIYLKYSLSNYFESFDEFYYNYQYHNELLWADYKNGKLKKSILRWQRFYKTIHEKGLKNKEIAKKIAQDYVDGLSYQNTVFPYAIDALEYLSKKYKLYVLTNGFKEIQDIKMKICKLDTYFQRVFTSEEMGFLKPQRGAFEFALNSVNAKKSESIMVGDDLKSDIIGAKTFGIDQVLFNPDNISHNENPTFEIQSLKQLNDIL